jgi:putative solute:sodium symporter small subunit
MASNNSEAMQGHWTKTRNLTYVVLFFWFIFSMVIPWNAHILNNYSFMGFELGYYMNVQGSLIVFVALIWIQNWRQDKIDDEFGVGE